MVQFFSKTIDISIQAFISTNKDYVRITPLTIDATPLNYHAMFPDRTRNKSLNSTFNNTQENLNGTKNLIQQGIQTPSHFVNETMPTTTQQSISPIHPTLKSSKNKHTAFPQTTIQSTVKPSIIPKYSKMDYQTSKPVTTSRPANKPKTSDRNYFSDQTYSFFFKNPKQQNPPIRIVITSTKV